MPNYNPRVNKYDSFHPRSFEERKKKSSFVSIHGNICIVNGILSIDFPSGVKKKLSLKVKKKKKKYQGMVSIYIATFTHS